MGYLTDFTDGQWAWIEPICRHRKAVVGVEPSACGA
jgi:hypothetical protein